MIPAKNKIPINIWSHIHTSPPLWVSSSCKPDASIINTRSSRHKSQTRSSVIFLINRQTEAKKKRG